ncbi:general secretion pathway protein GspB [Porticoccaceae bacterium LTM1]|nr:general secretion pathway protein GspB [Porticoccaceae bacterium LTM1]
MSYILDALEKSQKQREESDVPGLDNVHVLSNTQPEEPQSGGKRWVVIVLPLLAIAMAGGWWLAGYSPEGQPEPMNSITDTRVTESDSTLNDVQSLADTVGSTAIDSGPEEQATPDTYSIEVATQPIIEDTSTQTQTIGVPEKVGPEKVEQEVVSETVPSDVTPPVVKIAQTEEPINPATTPQQDQIKQSDEVDSIGQETAGSEVVSSEPPEQTVEELVVEAIPHYRALPFEIQQKIPEIRYSVHLYSPTPENRMVKIDGWVRKEGSTVYPEVKLLEITEKGAVFQYREYKFRVPVN